MSFISIRGGKILLRQPSINKRILELCGIFLLIIFAVERIVVSWRKWLDPQIDYGRELYIPWRMSKGARWLLDIDDLYGPLSRYIDTALFKFFGPGIMVLAWANIIIYFCILFLIYVIIKRAYGLFSAIVGSGIFIGVFSFSQLTITSNYNFVTPYSQQVTHGFGLCLLLILSLPNWIYNPKIKNTICVGMLGGLSVLLKPEFIVASGALILVASLVQVVKLKIYSIKLYIIGIISFLTPTVISALYISSYLSLIEAFKAASHAWLNSFLIWNDPLSAKLLNSFSGMDDIKNNLISHCTSSLIFILTIAIILLVLTTVNKFFVGFIKYVIIACFILSVFVFGIKYVDWFKIGQVLLILNLIYFSILIFYFFTRNSEFNANIIYKILFNLLAIMLMIRMMLNGRIYQYGFIQSSLATLVLSSVLLNDIPNLIRDKYIINYLYKLTIVLLVISFISNICKQSDNLYSLKTLVIGESSDKFITFSKNINLSGEIVKHFSTYISHIKNIKTLCVLPEGIMINYLTRTNNPVYYEAFFSSPEQEKLTLNYLKANNPEFILFLSRDLKEYGVDRYGTKDQSGYDIYKWFSSAYHPIDTYNLSPLLGEGGVLYSK